MTSPISLKLRAIGDELEGRLFERRDVIEASLVAMLAREHVLLIGVPGTAKTLAAEMLANRIVGAKQREVLATRQLPPEKFWGPLDLKALDDGRLEHDIEGYLPWADFIVINEIGKAGPTVLNELLSLLNERRFNNGRITVACPLVTCWATTNEELSIDEESGAIDDRFLLRLHVPPIHEDGNLMRYLQAVRDGAITAPAQTTVTLDELAVAQKEVGEVTVSDDDLRKLVQLHRSIDDIGSMSDRRLGQTVKLLQASAYLDGRDQVDADDFAVLAHAGWLRLDQRYRVYEKVMEVTSDSMRTLMSHSASLDEIAAKADQVMSVDASIKERGGTGSELQMKLADIAGDLAAMHAEHTRDGKSVARIEGAQSRVRSLHYRLMRELMGTPEAVARAASKYEGP